jgi:hypothetical protein
VGTQPVGSGGTVVVALDVVGMVVVVIAVAPVVTAPPVVAASSVVLAPLLAWPPLVAVVALAWGSPESPHPARTTARPIIP